jgi:hypothetical protein
VQMMSLADVEGALHKRAEAHNTLVPANTHELLQSVVQALPEVRLQGVWHSACSSRPAPRLTLWRRSCLPPVGLSRVTDWPLACSCLLFWVTAQLKAQGKACLSLRSQPVGQVPPQRLKAPSHFRGLPSGPGGAGGAVWFHVSHQRGLAGDARTQHAPARCHTQQVGAQGPRRPASLVPAAVAWESSCCTCWEHPRGGGGGALRCA